MRCLIAIALLSLVCVANAAQDEAPEPTEKLATCDMTSLKLGEFWYGMYTPDGNTEGYARMKFSETKGNGLHSEWEMHISGEGWNYEEERLTSYDSGYRLTYTEMSSGMQRVLAAREGNVMVGKSGVDDLRAEVESECMTGMGFILTACMPQAKDAKLQRHEYNEAQGLNYMGIATLAAIGEEEVTLPEGKVKAWKYELQRGEGARTLPVWVNAAREIVQVDWGTNNLMKLHREDTSALFKPAPPLFTQLEPEDKTKLMLTADFADYTIEEMWALWATGEGLAKWWPPEGEIEGKVGGKYHAIWKDENGDITWQLLGKVEAWEPNKKLGFSWKWSTDPAEAPTLHVVVEFKEIEGGVNLVITHSKFDLNNDDQQNRESLKSGWEFFGKNLKKKHEPDTPETPEDK